MVTLVYGYGVSGKSAVALLKKMNRKIAVYDDSNVEFESGVQDRRCLTLDKILENVGLIIVSPSINLNSAILNEARRRNIEIIGELEFGFRNLKGNVVAVTGTNGKTTTVELLTKMLQNAGIDASSYGNIGNGLAESSLDILEDKVAVVEVSSFQALSTELFCPKIAVCLNVSEDHLEYHKTFENYISSKQKIFKNQDFSDYAILNYDDIVVKNFANELKSNVYYFSKQFVVKGAYIKANCIYYKDTFEEFICNIDDINIKGEHNIENALACIVVCKILNIPNNIIVKTLKTFSLAPHRIEYVGKVGEVKFFNDSKSTNVGSTLSACKSMVGSTVLIVGGYDKGLSYKKLFEELPIKVHTIICFGANADKMIKDAKSMNTLTIIKADSIEEAVSIATKIRCDNVLFSPATSSYDRFLNYIERGEYFVKCIKGYIGDKFKAN